MMNEKDNLKIINQESLIEDLTINEAQATEVKGGAICHGVSVIAYARVNGPSGL